YGTPLRAEPDPDVLFTPSLPTIPPLVHTPLLYGSATLPGYYGSTHSYDYQGPYYGGPYLGFRDRLPYVGQAISKAEIGAAIIRALVIVGMGRSVIARQCCGAVQQWRVDQRRDGRERRRKQHIGVGFGPKWRAI